MIHHLFRGLLLLCGLTLALACRTTGSAADRSQATVTSPASDGYETAIRDTFAIYRDRTIAKDYNGIMDYIYPKLFEIVPREQLVAIFEGLDSEEMSFDFINMRIDSIGKPFTHEDTRYVLVKYNGQMALTLKGEMAQDEETLDMMVNVYKMSYGEDAVKRDPNSPRIEIDMHKTLFAIAPVGGQDWKFMENNEGENEMMQQLLPEAVREHFSN